jgi:hypothetical protein
MKRLLRVIKRAPEIARHVKELKLAIGPKEHYEPGAFEARLCANHVRFILEHAIIKRLRIIADPGKNHGD